MYRIDTRDFNLDHTLSCGQVFRWEKNDWWTGVVSGEIVRAKQEGDELIIDSPLGEKFIRDYFRLDDDMDRIYASVNRDEKIALLIKKYRGLRSSARIHGNALYRISAQAIIQSGISKIQSGACANALEGKSGEAIIHSLRLRCLQGSNFATWKSAGLVFVPLVS